MNPDRERAWALVRRWGLEDRLELEAVTEAGQETWDEARAEGEGMTEALVTTTWPREVRVKPTIGRIVYVVVRDDCDDLEDRAALVTAVREAEMVDVIVFGTHGLEFRHGVRHVELGEATPPEGTWHWPVKVEA